MAVLHIHFLIYLCTVERYKTQIMKNILKNTKKVILIVTVMASVIGYANETPSSLVKKDAKKTSLTLGNVKQGNLLSIKDINGLILYKEFIKQSGIYTKGFDLTALPDGDYIFELDKDVEIKTIPFTISRNKIDFDKEKESTFFKPITREKDDLIFISKLSLNKEPLDIKIYFEVNNSFGNYELVHSEKIENTKVIQKGYKLSKKGNYKIVYSSEGRNFIKFINEN